MRRIRVVSDAKFNTTITDAETGEPIEWVRRARIELSAEAFPTVWLEFVDVELDIVALEADTPPADNDEAVPRW